VLTISPSSYSEVSSPKYQTAPSASVEGDGVANDDARHAHDHTGVPRDLHDGALEAVHDTTLVHPPCARREREVRVVDSRGESAGSIDGE